MEAADGAVTVARVRTVREPELTSVCAGQPGCGAPRRNRTGDPILTMDRRTSAVLSGIFAGHSVPQGRSYGASWRAYLAARHSLIPFKVTASMIAAGDHRAN
jgi:hypothetical protein